jgi:hypothetical protein
MPKPKSARAKEAKPLGPERTLEREYGGFPPGTALRVAGEEGNYPDEPFHGAWVDRRRFERLSADGFFTIDPPALPLRASLGKVKIGPARKPGETQGEETGGEEEVKKR